mmetsp:Transcript_34011/g.79233  ORF Transcript_34011/g.79233 Transcript_34011/m.79233 type:complete len:280 (-) Transcript_34011:1091-1930(-)
MPDRYRAPPQMLGQFGEHEPHCSGLSVPSLRIFLQAPRQSAQEGGPGVQFPTGERYHPEAVGRAIQDLVCPGDGRCDHRTHRVLLHLPAFHQPGSRGGMVHRHIDGPANGNRRIYSLHHIAPRFATGRRLFRRHGVFDDREVCGRHRSATCWHDRCMHRIGPAEVHRGYDFLSGHRWRLLDRGVEHSLGAPHIRRSQGVHCVAGLLCPLQPGIAERGRNPDFYRSILAEEGVHRMEHAGEMQTRLLPDLSHLGRRDCCRDIALCDGLCHRGLVFHRAGR